MEQGIRGNSAGDRQRVDHERWFGALAKAHMENEYLSARELAVRTGAPLGTVHAWARIFNMRIPQEVVTIKLTPELRRLAVALATRRSLTVEATCTRLLARALTLLGENHGPS
jgi:hypothetical protein